MSGYRRKYEVWLGVEKCSKTGFGEKLTLAAISNKFLFFIGSTTVYLQVHSEMGFASVLPEDVKLHLSIDKPSCTRILLLSANRTRLYSL